LEENTSHIEKRLKELESNQIEQNRNIVSILKNVAEFGFDDKNPEKRKSAWIELTGYFLRQRVILLFTSLLTLIISGASIYIAFTANKLIVEQNNLIKDEFQLMEAERRSSLVFLFSNIMDAMDKELLEDYNNNTERDLSPQLTGRIISLSKRLKPYSSLENGEITKTKLSPERGQLLINIVEAKLSNKTLYTLLAKADFTSSDLRNSDLSQTILTHIKLDSSNLENSSFYKTEMIAASLVNCNLSQTNFQQSDLTETSFMHQI
jgi:uncharacterized protein YjbI with pentapeptide repeats